MLKCRNEPDWDDCIVCEDWVYIPSLKETFDAYHKIPSAICTLGNEKNNYFLHLELKDLFRGVFELFGEEWKFIQFGDRNSPYLHLKAIQPQSRKFLVGMRGGYSSSSIQAKIIPYNYATDMYKYYYISYASLEVLNPKHKLWIAPCTYNVGLNILFPVKRKENQLSKKLSKNFTPLPNSFTIQKKYFHSTYEWNVPLIKQHKALLLTKYARSYLQKKQLIKVRQMLGGH